MNETHKKYFEEAMFLANVKKNIDERIQDDSQKELGKYIDSLILEAKQGDLEKRKTLKEYIKTLMLTNLTVYEIENGKLKEEKVIENLNISKLDEKEEVLNWIIPFEGQLKAKDQFEIILYKLREHNDRGYDEAFSKFCTLLSYKKRSIGLNDFNNTWNEYTEEEIDNFYNQQSYSLTFEEKSEIIAQRVYEELYGYKAIDILAYSDINEVGLSTNGKYIYAWAEEKIRLSFLDLTENEVQVIQDRAIREGQLDGSHPEANGNRIDNGRITAIMAPYSNAKHLCIRIFNKDTSSVKDILGAQELQVLTQTLVKLGEKMFLGGELGSGKTTAMKTFLEIIDDSLHIGTIEDNFEQFNSQKYPNKRIVELQAKGGKSLIDAVMTLLRLSVDAASVGEIRDGEALFAYIQLAQAIANCTLSTGHIASAEDFVPRAKNMLIATGKYTSEKAAITDVINHINIIYHHKSIDGNRIIGQIVEIIPMIEKSSPLDLNNTGEMELQRLALIKSIQEDPAYMYRLNVLMEYENGKYILKNRPSERLQKKAVTLEQKQYMEQLLALYERGAD